MTKTAPTAKEGTAIRTKRAIIKLLKQEGPMDARQLSIHLELTGMAIRQHLYNLQEEQLVTSEEEARSMGRPAKMWRLTPEANRLFPDGHADLLVSMIESMREAFDEEGMEKMLEIRNRKQIIQYQNKAPSTLPLKDQLEALAQARTAEGYMAEIIDNEDGSFSFVEKHCPICEAAKVCSGLCNKELEMLQQVFSGNAEVERKAHMLTSGSRCAYLITPTP